MPEHGEFSPEQDDKPAFSHARDILWPGGSMSSFEFDSIVQQRGLHRVPAPGGGDVLMDETEFRRFEQSELPLLVYEREFDMRNDAHLVSEMLGDGPLAASVEAAFQVRIRHLSDAMRAAQRDEHYPVRTEEVARAQRDLYFMLSAVAGALGARDFQTGIEDRNTFVYPMSMKDMGDWGREFAFDVCTDSFANEGDIEVDPESELDPDAFRYWGELKITVNPSKRISFSYVPHEESARKYHEAQDVLEREGRIVYHEFSDLNFRLDLDDKAPEGLSLDFGRSDFEGETMLREGDLLGRVLATVSSDGGHTYEGFHRSMLDEFKPMAETLMMQLQLQLQERRDRFPDEETAQRIERRLMARIEGDSSPFTELDDYLAERQRQEEQLRRHGGARRFDRDLDRYRRTHLDPDTAVPDQEDPPRAA
jgi:hypothetical protein